ncbi:MAG: NAD(P)-dependent oxidoreductase [Bdellovibrionota bacterium]
MNLENTPIAVTGATGFLGRYIVDALLKRKARVIGVVRNPDRVPELKKKCAELRKADLGDKEALARSFEGVKAIVSNAALYTTSPTGQGWEEHLRTNIEGARNVFEAAAKAGVKRLVQVSSCAVYKGGDRNGIREDHPKLTMEDRAPFRSYFISKAVSEQIAWDLAKEHGLEVTAVRPSGIYGAFDHNFMPYFRALVWSPVVPMNVQPCMVYGGDVAEAIALILEKDSSIGKAYNTAGDRRTLGDLIEGWRKAGGRALPFRIPLPVPFKMVVDSGLAERELGWKRTPPEAAFRETLALEREASV